MTARLFRSHAPLTALLGVIDNRVRLLTRRAAQACSMARWDAAARRTAVGCRQLAHFEDRMLNDIGLRRDNFPLDTRERLQDRVMLFHI